MQTADIKGKLIEFLMKEKGYAETTIKNRIKLIKGSQIRRKLNGVEGVDEAFAVEDVFSHWLSAFSNSKYDIIMRVKADTMDQLKEIIRMRIHRMNNVRSTLILFVVEEK